jgi:hypothetical protein
LTIGLIIAGGRVLAQAPGDGRRRLVIAAAMAALMFEKPDQPTVEIDIGGLLGDLGPLWCRLARLRNRR